MSGSPASRSDSHVCADEAVEVGTAPTTSGSITTWLECSVCATVLSSPTFDSII